MIRNVKYFILVCLVSFIFIPNVGAEAKTLGDLRKAYEELLAEKQAADNKSAQAQAEIAANEAAKTKAQADLTKAEEEEEETEQKIVESNEKIEENKAESQKVLLYMQQIQSQNAYVEYVTGSSSMTELVSRVEAVKQVTDYIQVTLNNLEAEIKKNEELKIELEEKQKNLSEQIVAYQNAISKLYDDVESYNESSLTLEEKVEVAKTTYEAQKKICKTNLGRDDDDVVIADCSNMPSNGAWLKPLTSGVVTSPMGYRTHPVTGQVYKFHDGIDIGVSEGTPVYAAAAGEVAAIVSRSSCGGNKVYVNVIVNGKKYTTWYYHLLRFGNISVGDTVSQDTIIGYVGGYSTSTYHGGYDGCTTGAHLHFGVQTGFYSGVVQSRVIAAPGFHNVVGYRFTSRYDYYGS